jgi:energy-coupling factor transporter transmembrane protein EcfT
MSNDVYAAMLARGFGGEIRTFDTYRARPSDWVALAGVAAVAVAAVLAGRILP